MKKITIIFSLMLAMFTTAMAQESVNLETGTFSGEWGNKDTRSVWTSDNGLTIVSTDGSSETEIGTMSFINNHLQLNITTDVKNPSTIGTKYTIIVPEGYKLTEMIVVNGARTYNTFIEYNNTTLPLTGSVAEQTIKFSEGETSFYLRSESSVPTRDFIKIRKLVITKVEGDNEGEGEEGEVEGGESETSINEVKVENAQVIYDLTGRRVDEITEKGIYIINGKKVIK